jgi:YD repeat-containing protein
VTTLALEANGYLASITNPHGDKTELTYTAEGLLATMKDARGNLHTNTYDAQGRLIKDEDPAGDSKPSRGRSRARAGQWRSARR